ncbi:MAG: response regulator transcription factor [Clostridia bacterium]|nr:response regulator transcription factor [Clostridia bacterium]
MSPLIYAADDEENIRNLIKMFLESSGFAVEIFPDGEKLLEQFRRKPCDLVILDIMMPGRDGFDICSEIRKGSTIPIIMLTARAGEMDYIKGLSVGSDDYFTKPFSPMSLVMRVKAMLRRVEMDRAAKVGEALQEGLSYEDIQLNQNQKSARCGHSPLDLTPTEFDLLSYLLVNKDRAVSRSELLNKIWGYENAVETRVTDDTVKRLRKKLSDANSRTQIETLWGFGFKLSRKEDSHEKA